MKCPVCERFKVKVRKVRNFTCLTEPGNNQPRYDLTSITYTFHCKTPGCGNTWTEEVAFDGKDWWHDPKDPLGCLCYFLCVAGWILSVIVFGFLLIDPATICLGYGLRAYFFEGLRFANSKQGVLNNGQEISAGLEALRGFLCVLLILVCLLVWQLMISALARKLKDWLLASPRWALGGKRQRPPDDAQPVG